MMAQGNIFFFRNVIHYEKMMTLQNYKTKQLCVSLAT